MTLTEFFSRYPKVALGFSGGVDSAYLLYCAKKSGAQVGAFFVKTPFQPAFELEDAQCLASELGVELTVLYANPLQEPKIAENPKNRCYFCKKVIFSAITKAAKDAGYSILLDGTNASDDVSDRPGYQALQELDVLSPLRLCGLTKDEIRKRSQEAGLFTWDKPAYACLATRIPTGTPITDTLLQNTETAEDCLRKLGFRDFRVRYLAGSARIQVPADDFPRVLSLRQTIRQALLPYYDHILLDLEERI